MNYVVWGVPPGGDPAEIELGLAERPLYTRAETRAEAERAAVVLERDHGCQRLRIQCLADGGSVQDMFRGAVRGNAR